MRATLAILLLSALTASAQVPFYLNYARSNYAGVTYNALWITGGESNVLYEVQDSRGSLTNWNDAARMPTNLVVFVSRYSPADKPTFFRAYYLGCQWCAESRFKQVMR